jgi:hypothetical protein
MKALPVSAESVRAMYAGGRANAAGRRFARFWALVFGLGRPNQGKVCHDW